eukprot:9144462-Pyramimonas_sp.AAC.1
MFAPGNRRSKAVRSNTNGEGPRAASARDVPGKVGPKWPEGPEGASEPEQDTPRGFLGGPA